jgi:two-component system sensor histidine kinase/response regulator
VLRNPQRYAALLRGFVDAQAAAVPHIRRALAATDSQTAIRLTHTLQGSAANIAAPELVHAAGAVEQCLRRGADQDEREGPLTTLEVILQAQVKAIRVALMAITRPVLPTHRGAPDQQQLAAVCRQLTILLTNDDGNAERLLAEYANMLQMAFPQYFSELRAAVNRFDSERALAILQAAMSADAS